VDLLLVSWNRSTYLSRTLAALFADVSNFRLYCWDNGSTDGAADIVADIRDPRLVKRHFSKVNVKQRLPCLWFANQATSDIVGRLGDDVLNPPGWLEALAPPLRKHDGLGALACWCGPIEEFDPQLAARRTIRYGDIFILPNLWTNTASALIRASHFRKYFKVSDNFSYGDVTKRSDMAKDGLLTGWLMPPLFAHHMDDPRSPFCVTYEDGRITPQGAMTARHRGFQTVEEFVAWLKENDRSHFTTSYDRQLEEHGVVPPPPSPWKALRGLARSVLMRFIGTVCCESCGWRGRSFLNSGAAAGGTCPSCRADARERQIAAACPDVFQAPWSQVLESSRIILFAPWDSGSVPVRNAAQEYPCAGLFDQIVDQSMEMGPSQLSLAADSSFDVALVLDFLDAVCDTALAGREVHRVLRPGGKAIIATCGHRDEEALDILKGLGCTSAPLAASAGEGAVNTPEGNVYIVEKPV